MVGENRQWSAKTLRIYFLGHGTASNNLPLLCAATFRGQKDERTRTEAGMISAVSSEPFDFPAFWSKAGTFMQINRDRFTRPHFRGP